MSFFEAPNPYAPQRKSGLQRIADALMGHRAQGQFPAPPPAPGQIPELASTPATSGGFPPAPAAPMAAMGTPADVYAGKARAGTANGGALVSRDQFGNFGIKNKFGVTSYTNEDGRSVAHFGGPTESTPPFQGLADALMRNRPAGQFPPAPGAPAPQMPLSGFLGGLLGLGRRSGGGLY